MTSTERRAARYQRRQERRRYRRFHAKTGPDNYERKCRRTGGRYNSRPITPRRAEKWRAYVPFCDDFDWVFSESHLWESHFKCRKGKRWKRTVQRFDLRAPIDIHEIRRRLMKGIYRPGPLNCFNTIERGKERAISAERYKDRVVSCCMYQYAIVPGICRHFIHDCGANLEGKGQKFSVDRAVVDLRHYFLEYGTDGYAFTFDLRHYFDSVPHESVHASCDKAFTDKRLTEVERRMTARYGKKGLGLGSPVNQALALESANKLDHYIQEQLTAEARAVFGLDIPPLGKYYGRYMDDGRLYYPIKRVLQWAVEKIRAFVASIGHKLHDLKSHIVRITKFTWLKVKFRLTETGKVIKKIAQRSVTRMRQKLKKLRRKVDAGIITERDVYNGWRSWCGHAKHFNCICAVIKMFKLYLDLYSYRPRKEIKLKCGKYEITEANLPLMLSLMQQRGFARVRTAA